MRKIWMTPRGQTEGATGSAAEGDAETGRSHAVDVERLAVGVAIAAVGVGAIVGGFEYGVVRATGGIGPGAVPLAVGILLAVEGLLLSRAAWATPSSAASPVQDVFTEEEDGPIADDGDKGELIGSMILVAMLAGVLLLTPYLGFVPMIVVFAFTAARFFENLSIRTSLILGLIAGGFIWIVFIGLLGVRLPVLPFFF